MSEYEASRIAAQRSDIVQKTMKTDGSNDDDDTLEDLAGSANNSIIGKVKSRVSSIIPTSFSKWFSPSTRNNDSLNGSFSVGTTRRRRRLEIEDDEEYADDGDTNEDGVLSRSEYKENLVSRSDNVNKDSDEDDSDNNSEDDSPNEPVVSVQRTHRTTKTSSPVNQPPSKRSRISFDVTSAHHQPLIASTPAVGVSRRNINSHAYPLVEDTLSKPSTSPSLSYFSETNVYNQKKMEQPATYAFLPAPDSDANSQEKFANRLNTNEKQSESVTAISSRRTLHLPSTSQAAKERAASMSFSSFKRQSLSGIRDINNQNAVSPTINTSTAIIEEAFGKDEGNEFSRQDKQAEVQVDAKSRRKVNGSTLPFVGSKKQKLNGTDETEVSNVDADSASDSSEGCMDLPNNLTQRKTGLFNMSHLNCHNGNKSRTSSFGNGINFYSHLEGRKSLFSGGANIAESANALNNSTLSLTSLNRRQFNASIYGSTSALSDSRLLNTFSPFYKGKTTYGGAAAYKKISAGSGASKICNLTPTIIRPTSSLSTLSSSNNSGTANIGGTNALGGIGGNDTENTSAISSTAKRILDLINGFATPLSEAKKMANTSVKTNPQLLPQAKSRLNETDLQASRAIRLSQVRTPYTRPAVTLQPTIKNSALPPPVRELQVPSMSQLLQMKKMQSTTERSRQITMQNSSSTMRPIVGGSEYVLPITNENNVLDREDSQTRQQQQSHTNKIKSRPSARITSSKNVTNLEIEQSPPPVNLPNIAFPLMQSVPKFDIALPKPSIVAPARAAKPDFPKLDNLPNANAAVAELKTVGSDNSKNVLANKTACTLITDSKKIAITERSKDTEDSNSNGSDKKSIVTDRNSNISFKFSAPLTFEYVEDNSSPEQNVSALSKNYKFSPPTAVCFGAVGTNASSTNRKVQSGGTVTPQLKSGSVLDALKKPFTLPSTPKDNSTNSGSTEMKTGFGDKFKKNTSNKWECKTCLIYNASDTYKCVACETPRIKSSSTPPTEKSSSTTLLATTSSQFGAQFKKSSDEWECGTCMVRNKQQADKCVACETSRKGANAPSQLGSRNWQSNSFGDAFKKKTNTWDCPTCLINNKIDCTECVACQTKNPGSGSGDSSSACSKANTKSTTYTFGFNTVASTASAQSNAPSDMGFKSLAAAQMSAKWECDACMTRNDAARNKCICCEQAKPGTTTPDVPTNGPKFTFGSAASSKFTFGFGTNTNGTSATDSGVVTTSVTAPNQKTDAENITGFVFGSNTKAATLPSGGSGFSFGIKPTSHSPKNEVTSKGSESKDVADSVNSSNPTISEATPSAFKFSTSTTSVGITNTTVNFKFGVSPSSGTATTTTTATPATKFSLTKPDVAAKNVPEKSSEPNAPIVESTTGGFKFGNSITNANLQPAASSFSFGVPAKSIGTETSTTTTTTNTFSFGASASTQPGQSSTTTTSTATVKPMFSFGSITTPTTTAAASTLASSSTTSSSTTASAFTNTAGGFSFGSNIAGGATAPPTSKPIFGSFIAPTAVSVAPSAVASAPGSTIPTLSAAPTNVFGTFGGSTSSAKTTTTSATPTLASTAALPATNTQLFGSCASVESKPTASATMIFGSAGNKPAATVSTTSAAPFIFGSSTSIASTQGTTTNTVPSGNTVAPTTSWPKSGFAFGTSPASTGTSNTNEAPKAVFGTFTTAAAPTAAASAAPPALSAGSSVFGSLGGSSKTSGSSATFGSLAVNAAAVNPTTLFGANAPTSSTAAQSTQNLFGSVSTATSSFGAPPSFGNSSSNNTPTFGTASSATFGSFGTAASSTSGDGASAPKKAEPAFNFGGSNPQIRSSGGFNFGMQAGTTAKSAFNFTASSGGPAFNFTGSNSDAAKPFQFGATQSAPVFNFSGGAVEATPNAPFQFNAGTAPAPSNIFAPTPSAPNAPGAMQARRKIRQPTRRLTPR